GGFEVGTGEQTVVQGLESNATLGQLALEIFMAVETELGRVREVGAKLEEKGAEVLIAAVEVIDVDQGGGIDDPRNRAAAGQSLAGGAGHTDFFLGDADKDDALVGFEGSEFLLQDVVLALALFKTDQLQALPLDKGLNGFNKTGGHLDGLF